MIEVKIVLPQPRFTITDRFFMKKDYEDNLAEALEDEDDDPLPLSYFNCYLSEFAFGFDKFYSDSFLIKNESGWFVDLAQKGEFRYRFENEENSGYSDCACSDMSESEIIELIAVGDIIYTYGTKEVSNNVPSLGTTLYDDAYKWGDCAFITGYRYENIDGDIGDNLYCGYFCTSGLFWRGDGLQEYPHNRTSSGFNFCNITVNPHPSVALYDDGYTQRPRNQKYLFNKPSLPHSETEQTD